MTLRLRLYSDLHLEFAPFEPPPADCDVVVLAGDIHVSARALPWIRRHFEVPVVYVLGNHEFYRSATPLLFRLLSDWTQGQHNGADLHILENQSARIGDTEFFGCTLWTDFELHRDPVAAQHAAEDAMNDYALIRCGDDLDLLTPADTRRFHHRSREWLSAAIATSDATRKVVVTHHAPSPRSLKPGFRGNRLAPAYASDLESWLRDLEVDLWLHGHTHHCVDYRLGGTRVVANQRGYVPQDPVQGFDPDGLLSID